VGAICTLALEKQDWDFVSFLVCIAPLIYIIVLGIYFVLIFTALIGVLGSFLGLCVPKLGRNCICL
jgi:hypothetical protein